MTALHRASPYLLFGGRGLLLPVSRCAILVDVSIAASKDIQQVSKGVHTWPVLSLLPCPGPSFTHAQVKGRVSAEEVIMWSCFYFD